MSTQSVTAPDRPASQPLPVTLHKYDFCSAWNYPDIYLAVARPALHDVVSGDSAKVLRQNFQTGCVSTCNTTPADASLRPYDDRVVTFGVGIRPDVCNNDHAYYLVTRTTVPHANSDTGVADAEDGRLYLLYYRIADTLIELTDCVGPDGRLLLDERFRQRAQKTIQVVRKM